MVRVFTGNWTAVSGRVILKTKKKLYLMPPCLYSVL